VTAVVVGGVVVGGVVIGAGCGVGCDPGLKMETTCASSSPGVASGNPKADASSPTVTSVGLIPRS
jgi:hypothetical protein